MGFEQETGQVTGERAHVEGTTEGRLHRRAVAWARKEAALKALGLGLTLDPAAIETPPSGIRTRVQQGTDHVTVLDLVTTPEGVVGAVAVVGDHLALSVALR